MEFKTFNKDKLLVKIYPDKDELGKAAAQFVADEIRFKLKMNGSAKIILATGASQFSFLRYLQMEKIDWQNITVFHLDEYIGLGQDHPASFRRYLKERILDHVKPATVNFLNGDAPDPEKEAKRYEELLQREKIDVACIGIGENGHIAFNDPPVADFNDPRLVKKVELDNACRSQQMGEGWFPSLNDVPSHALSLTVPAIMRAEVISCVVPDERKARAVYDAIHGAISTACPASILRTHPSAVLFLDRAAASGLKVF